MSGGAVKVARETLHIALTSYGMVSGPGFSMPRARLWLLAEPSSNFGVLRIAYNNRLGKVEWRDVGTVVAALINKNRWQFTLEDGTGAAFVPAPCACGGGAASMAGPSGLPHYTAVTRADTLPWIRNS